MVSNSSSSKKGSLHVSKNSSHSKLLVYLIKYCLRIITKSSKHPCLPRRNAYLLRTLHHVLNIPEEKNLAIILPNKKTVPEFSQFPTFLRIYKYFYPTHLFPPLIHVHTTNCSILLRRTHLIILFWRDLLALYCVELEFCLSKVKSSWFL